MGSSRSATMLRFFKPVIAGIALAYLVTGVVDKPAPVYFQLKNPYVAKQLAIVELQTDVVEEKNIMKLGSSLSVMAIDGNPLSRLEETAPSNEASETFEVLQTDVDQQPAPPEGGNPQ